MSRSFYRQLAKQVNQTVGRKAISAEQIYHMVKKARRLRQQYGFRAVMQYAQELPYQMFRPQELHKLQQSPYWHEYCHAMIDLLIREHVLTPFEGRMARRYV